MQIRLYNTMTRKLEEFKPITPNHVGYYNCGPTVYWDQHLGNMRTFLNADILKRMLLANGYTVNHVMNYTDVGHLTSDEDTGEEVIKEIGKEILSKGAWPNVMFFYQERDPKSGEFTEPKVVLRRYRKMASNFKPQGKFKITGKAQAEAIIDVLKKWYNI